MSATAIRSTTPRRHRGSVLIVDDDTDLRAILEEVFRDEGYAVATAPNGAVAMRVVSAVDPDVIVLDVNMPVMDGVAFASAYQRRPGRHAPIVVFSTADRERVQAIGPASVVTKPGDIEVLLATVGRQIPA